MCGGVGSGGGDGVKALARQLVAADWQESAVDGEARADREVRFRGGFRV